MRLHVPKDLGMTMLQSYYNNGKPSLRYMFQWGSVCIATKSKNVVCKNSFGAKAFIGKTIGVESSLAPNRYLVTNKKGKIHKPRNVRIYDVIYDYHQVENAMLLGRKEDDAEAIIPLPFEAKNSYENDSSKNQKNSSKNRDEKFAQNSEVENESEKSCDFSDENFENLSKNDPKSVDGPMARTSKPRAAKNRGFVPRTDAGYQLGPGIAGDAFKILNHVALENDECMESKGACTLTIAVTCTNRPWHVSIVWQGGRPGITLAQPCARARPTTSLHV